MSQTLDISNYDPCYIKYSKFEISNVYIIRLQGYRVTRTYVCGKDSVPVDQLKAAKKLTPGFWKIIWIKIIDAKKYKYNFKGPVPCI